MVREVASLSAPYSTAGTLPSRRRRRLAPFPMSLRSSALRLKSTLLIAFTPSGFKSQRFRDQIRCTASAGDAPTQVHCRRGGGAVHVEGADRLFVVDAADGLSHP